MLGPDLDVEADLSIDSIKRLEILSELADEIGLSDDGNLDALEDLVAELAARKTLRGIVGFLFEHAALLGAGETPAPTAESEPTVTEPAAEPNGIPPAANRFVIGLHDAPLGEAVDPTELVVRVTGDGPLATVLVDELRARGVDAGTDLTTASGTVVMTDLLADRPPEMPELYGRLRPLLLDTACDVVVVSPLGGGLGIDPPTPARADGDPLPVGAGVRGMVKTAALEFSDRRIRLVDVDPATSTDDLARLLADESVQRHSPVEVAWRDGHRRASHIAPRPHRPRGDDAEGAAGAVPLTKESVVLLTGGARGITARVAVALAERSGCRVELVGRSALPDGDEAPDLAACGDRMALRGVLAKAGWRDPKAIDKECDRILAAREVAATLADLAAAGAEVTYHQVDVSDADALRAVVGSVYERHGRLDGVVHGAGILDDHNIVDKPVDSFARVVATKVDGARTLLGALRDATAAGRARPSFVVFFGSTAGVAGNRGQVDYATANDALDAMAATHHDVAEAVLALDWGPWSSEHGMVSEALATLFESAGMGLIQIEDGTSVLLDEVAAAVAGETRFHQVTVARCSPELMAAAFGQEHGHEHDDGHG